MACLDKAQNRIREILKENGYDMRTKVAREVESLAARMLDNIEEVIPDSPEKKVATEVVYRVRKSLERGVDGVDYWDGAIRKFIDGRTITVHNPDGGSFVGTVRNSVLTVSGALNIGVEGANGKLYDYNLDPNTGRTIDGVVIDELKNVYSLMTNELGSNDSITIDDTRFDLLENDLNNDPRKARNLLRELDELEVIPITPEHKSQLDKVINTFIDSTKNYIPQMKVYLETNADANGGALRFTRKRGAIYLQAGKRDQQFAYDPTIREVFAHETVHAAVEFGREYNRAEVAGTMNRVRKLHRQFFKNFKPEDLVPEDSQYGRPAELENARELFKYMQGKNGIAEFIAHGLTNPQVVAKLKELEYYEGATRKPENMFEKLTAYLEEILDKVFATFRGEQGQKADEILLKLSLDLAEANNRATYHAKRGLGTRATELIDEGNKAINKVMDKALNLVKSKSDEIPDYEDIGDTRNQRAIWMMKNLGRLATDKKLRPILENFMSELLGSIGRPENTLQTLVRNFRTPDQLQRIVERFGRLSSTIDNVRDEHKNDIMKLMMEGFKEPLTTSQDSSLGAVILENDVASIGHYSDAKIAEVLSDSAVLEAETKRVKRLVDELSDRYPDTVYYNNMARKLGQFLATGKGDETTLLNARNIARKLNDRPIDIVDENLVKAIDELATLYALRYTQPAQKEEVAELIRQDSNGVRAVIMMQDGLKKASEELLDRNRVFEVKGYVKDVTNERKNIKVDFVGNKEELEADGYELVKELNKSVKDESRGSMGLYISDSYGQLNHNRVALRLTNQKKAGTSLRDVYKATESKRGRAKAALNIERIKLDAEKSVAVLHRKDQTEDIKEGLIPLFNEDGEIVDFRYMMPKDRKAKYLDRDNRASVMLGKTSASIYDKSTTRDFNRKVVEEMIADRDANYNGTKYGNNDKEYVVVGRNSDEKELRELWAIMPDNLKVEIEEQTGTKGIPVRRDLLFSYFGFRDVSIVNADIVNRNLSKTAKSRLRIAETIWKEIVSISKVSIVIKTPAVLIGNVVSNFVLSAQLGMNPVDVAKFQLDGVRELREYRNSFKELTKLQIKQRSGLASSADNNRAQLLQTQLDKSPVKDLMDEGLFQSIIEDTNAEDGKAGSVIETKITEYLQDKHKFVKEGFNWTYMSERNPLYKTLLTGTQYSDFVARYSLYQAYRIKGIPKKTAIERVNDAFINYGIPDSKLLQYMNDMGFVMFTKYFLRIQRVIKEGVQEKPLNFMLALIGQEYLIGDVEDVMDQSLFDKDWGNVVHNPLEQLKNLVIPPGFEVLDTVVIDPLLR